MPAMTDRTTTTRASARGQNSLSVRPRMRGTCRAGVTGPGVIWVISTMSDPNSVSGQGSPKPGKRTASSPQEVQGTCPQSAVGVDNPNVRANPRPLRFSRFFGTNRRAARAAAPQAGAALPGLSQTDGGSVAVARFGTPG